MMIDGMWWLEGELEEVRVAKARYEQQERDKKEWILARLALSFERESDEVRRVWDSLD